MVKHSSNKAKIHRAALFRNETLDFMGRMFSDFDPIFYGHKNRSKTIESPDDEYYQYDGLIRTSAGFYRVFEDERDGTRVMLFSYEYENLIPEKKVGGNWRLPNADRVYVVDEAVGRTSLDYQFNYQKGMLMRDIMHRHYVGLLDMTFNHTNMYAMDLTPFYTKKDPNPGRVIRIGNGELAYGLFEQKDGSFIVRLYVEDEDIETDDMEHWVKIDERPAKGFFGTTLSAGQGAGKYDSLSDALMFCFEDWSKRAVRVWSGQPVLTDLDKIKAPHISAKRLAQNAFKALQKQKMHRVAIVAAIVAGTFSLSEDFTKSAIIGAGAAVAYAIRDLLVEEILLKGWNRVHDGVQLHPSHHSASVRGKLADRYKIDTKENHNRWCSKIRPDVLTFLRPLCQNETGIANDVTKYTPYQELNNPEHWLATVQNKLFGSFVCPLNSRMGTALSPANGLVGVFHVSNNHQVKTSYLALRSDFSFNSQVLVPQESLERLSEGIVKVVHKSGTLKPVVKTIGYKQFTREIRALEEDSNFEDPDDIEQDLRHIHYLFNESQCALREYAELSAYMCDKYPELNLEMGEFDVGMWLSHKWRTDHASVLGLE